MTPCLWFDGEAEQAAQFYTSIFPGSRITRVTRYGEAGTDVHGREPGSVLTAEFEINGSRFMGLNGGPHFTFTPAVSFVITCKSQEEVNYYWDRLSDGGDEEQCGWLRDRFGVSWQVVPEALPRLLQDPDPDRAARAMNAMLQMRRLDIAALQAAADGP